METYKPLTPGEKKVLELSAKDLTIKGMSSYLIRSDHTPKNHMCNAKKKLKVHTAAGAVARAHQLREIDLDKLKNE